MFEHLNTATGIAFLVWVIAQFLLWLGIKFGNEDDGCILGFAAIIVFFFGLILVLSIGAFEESHGVFK